MCPVQGLYGKKLKKNRRLTRELNTHTLGRTERLTGLSCCR